jgi:hypothetical protein
MGYLTSGIKPGGFILLNISHHMGFSIIIDYASLIYLNTLREGARRKIE